MEFGIVKQQENIEVLKAKLVVAKSNWESIMNENPAYQELVTLQNIIADEEKKIEETKNAIIQDMVKNNLTDLSFGDIQVKLKDTSRPSVEILDEKLVPSEYIRTKTEVDKTKIMDMYKKGNIIVAGVNIVKNPNYKLDVKVNKKAVK